MRSARLGYGLVVAVYLLSFPYHPGLRSPNELCRLFQARAIAEFHSLSINEVLKQQGGVGDLSCTATVEEGGQDVLKPCVGPEAPAAGVKAVHYYSSKAPLLSFLGAPVYLALSLFGPVTELGQVFFSRLLWTVFPSLALLWLLRRVLMTIAPDFADVVTILYAMGTMAYAYAEAYMSHQVTAVLAFSCFFCAWRVLRGEWRQGGWVLAGFAAGCTVLAEYTGALTVVCLALWVAVELRAKPRALSVAVGLVAVGALLPVSALLAYHQACFGHPLQSGYKFLNDAAYMGWHQGGFLGIRLPDARALVLSFFSPLRGLLTMSPVLVGAILGSTQLKQKAPNLLWLTVILAAANTYFTASFTYDSWGWTVGPRHLTPWVPFLMLPLALAFESASGARKSLLFGLGVASLISSTLAAFVAYVPADVSTSVFGLAVPLLREGVLPVSWLPAVGITNPVGGLVLMVLAAAIVVWVVTQARARGAGTALVVAVVIAHLALLALATNTPGPDKSARDLLTNEWLAKPGQPFSFF
jgi:hypothetical protein